MRYLIYYGLLFLLLSSKNTLAADTIKVYFDFGRYELTTEASYKLDSLAYDNILSPYEQYGILGYADYVGNEESNIELSQKRANTVKAYLQGLGVKNENIETVIGKGEISRDIQSERGYATDRRVDIIPGGFKEKTVVEKQPTKPTIQDISKVEKNQTLRLENILFLPGSHKVRKDSEKEMFLLYLTMRDNPKLKISIEGHICCLTHSSYDGYDYDNKDYRLSENRAKTIYQYLLEKGIAKDRMTFKGFGLTKPLLWPEKTPEDENNNRRVEIRIVDK